MLCAESKSNMPLKWSKHNNTASGRRLLTLTKYLCYGSSIHITQSEERIPFFSLSKEDSQWHQYDMRIHIVYFRDKRPIVCCLGWHTLSQQFQGWQISRTIIVCLSHNLPSPLTKRQKKSTKIGIFIMKNVIVSSIELFSSQGLLKNTRMLTFSLLKNALKLGGLTRFKPVNPLKLEDILKNVKNLEEK